MRTLTLIAIAIVLLVSLRAHGCGPVPGRREPVTIPCQRPHGCR